MATLPLQRRAYERTNRKKPEQVQWNFFFSLKIDWFFRAQFSFMLMHFTCSFQLKHFFSLYWASFDDINRLQSSSFWSFWINSIVFLFIRSEFFFGLNSSYWIKYFIRHFSSFYIILHCLFGFFDFKILFSIYFPFIPISTCKFKYFLPWNASHFNFIK